MVAVYTILFVLTGLSALILLIAAFLPDRYNIERSAIILQPVRLVMDKVADLHYYAQWNPWQKTEPGSKAEITGTPKKPGHTYHWEGKKIGIGQLILRNLDDKHIHFALEFLKPWKAKASDNWLFEEWGNDETKVTWQNNGNLPFPLGRLMGPMLVKRLHKQFEEGLKNLKQLCEQVQPRLL